MRYTLFIDESGSISLNNGEKYFCIGGYLIENKDMSHMYKMIKMIKLIRKDGEKYFKKKIHNFKNAEVKFSNLNVDGKNFVYDHLKNFNGTFVGIIVDKENCTTLTKHKQNDYYNYLVKLLIKYIFETRNYSGNLNFKELKIIYDNRSMAVEANNDLQAYLIKQFKLERRYNRYCCNFNIREADSKVSYGVMVSDFIAGLCWAKYNFGEQKYGNQIKINYLSKFPYQDFGKEKNVAKVLTFA